MTIPVDVNALWKVQKPFCVHSAESMAGVGSKRFEFYKGFGLTMEIDPRDAVSFDYKAVVLNDNTIAVTAPLRDHHDAGGDLDLEHATIGRKDNPRNDNNVIWEFLLNGRNEYAKLELENKMVYHVVFNGGVQLSSDVLACHANCRDKMLVEGLKLFVTVPEFGEREWAVDEHGRIQTDERGRRILVEKQYCKMKLIWRFANIACGTRKHDTGPRNPGNTDAYADTRLCSTN